MYENYFISDHEALEEDTIILKNHMTLSRYLYSVSDIKQTLFLSILNHDHKQALFWGYELYFSGFQEEAFDYLLDISKIAFQVYPMDCEEDSYMNDHISYCRHIWLHEPLRMHHQLGNCILAMCRHNHNLSPFIEKYFKIDTMIKLDLSDDDICVTFNPEDVDEYNQSFNDKPNYRVLEYARTYAVNKTYNQLFQTHIHENPKEMYIDNWLYYASFSPLWEKRILEYGGIINEEDHKVIFENEDLEEEFYNHWNYEPDEQSTETQQKAMGKLDTPQYTLETFCKHYGYHIIEHA